MVREALVVAAVVGVEEALEVLVVVDVVVEIAEEVALVALEAPVANDVANCLYTVTTACQN